MNKIIAKYSPIFHLDIERPEHPPTLTDLKEDIAMEWQTQLITVYCDVCEQYQSHLWM